MSTVRDLITGSLRKIGVIASGETPAASELSDGLSALNQMLDDWSSQNLLMFKQTREAFDLITDQQVYTMGPGGDFDTDRPSIVERAGTEYVGSVPPVERPIEILNHQKWAEIAVKTQTSSVPRGIFVDETAPSLSIYVYPVPSGAGKLVIYSKKPLTAFATLDDEVTLPPAYGRALEFNLAVEIAPEFGKEAPATVQRIANNSMANIKRQNIKPRYLKSDVVADCKNVNIYSGE